MKEIYEPRLWKMAELLNLISIAFILIFISNPYFLKRKQAASKEPFATEKIHF